MASWLEPIVAAVTAAVISATSPATATMPAAHTATNCESSPTSVVAVAGTDQIRDVTARLALLTRHDVLAELQPMIEQLRGLCLTPGATSDRVVGRSPDDEDDDESDGGPEDGEDDRRGGDGGPTPAPTPRPAPPTTQPGTPVPGAPAAQLEQALRELATALQTSSDPAMRQLGADLLGMLGGVTDACPAPLPTPGASTAPATPGPSLPSRPCPGLPSVLPSGATELFADDFEGGDLSKWGTCQGASVNGDCAGVTVEDGMGVGQDPERGMVAQFRITDGQEAEMGGERSEVRDDNNPGTLVKEGDDRWYAWSMKFPADMADTDGIWNLVMQWHQSADSGSPSLALDISKGTVDIGGDGSDGPRQTVGPVHRGEWTDYVLHVKFSKSDGFVEAWENGVQTVQRASRATMSDDQSYLKMGIYRDPDATGDAEVWFDDLQIFDGGGSSPGVGPRPADDGNRSADGDTDRGSDSDVDEDGRGDQEPGLDSVDHTPLPTPTAPPPGTGPAGTWYPLGAGMASNVSGAAPMPGAPGSVLIARDNKKPDENRLSTVAFTGTGEPTVTPIQWSGELPRDIEALDAVPGRPGEFVTLTSAGAGQHIRLDGTTARTLGTFTVPGEGEKYEGLALAQLDGGIVAVWADRGQADAPATLAAATFDPATLTFGMPTQMEFTAADLPADARDISDVKLGPDGRLLVTSAWEAGDDGPFDGALYDAGTVAVGPSGVTLTPPTDRAPLLTVDGQKIEAITCDQAGTCVLGADNENLGGALSLVVDPRAIPVGGGGGM